MEKSGFGGVPVGKPLQIGPVGSIRRSYLHDSVYLVGDAAESLDPIAGMGMTHGILTAECAVRALVSDLVDGVLRPWRRATYVREATRALTPTLSRIHPAHGLAPAQSACAGLLLPALSFARLPEMVRSSLEVRRGGDPALAFAMHFLLALIGAVSFPAAFDGFSSQALALPFLFDRRDFHDLSRLPMSRTSG